MLFEMNKLNTAGWRAYISQKAMVNHALLNSIEHDLILIASAKLWDRLSSTMWSWAGDAAVSEGTRQQESIVKLIQGKC
jgi:hypothetical protein